MQSKDNRAFRFPHKLQPGLNTSKSLSFLSGQTSKVHEAPGVVGVKAAYVEDSNLRPRTNTFPTSGRAYDVPGVEHQDVKDATEALIEAVGDGKLSEVQRMLASDAVIEINRLSTGRNWVGEAALHVACMEEYPDIVNALLDTVPGINVNCQNARGCTPLHLACQQQSGSTIRRLLDVPNIDVNSISNEQRNTPLHDACESGDEGGISQLLEDKSILVQIPNRAGYLALHFAAETTAWMWSSPTAIEQCITALLQLGGPEDLTATTIEGRNALHLAAMSKNLPAVKVLLRHPKQQLNTPVENTGDTALHLAMPDTPIACLLLEKGIDSSAQNGDGDTALHICCKPDIHFEQMRQNIENTMRLLMRKIPVRLRNAQNKRGETILHLMVATFPVHMLRQLLHATSPWDATIQNGDGKTPFDVAVETRNAEIIELLLGVAKVDVNARSSDGWTPLQLAARRGINDMVAVLLNQGANPSYTSRNPFIPNAAAVASNAGHIEVADFIRHFRRRNLMLEILDDPDRRSLCRRLPVWIWSPVSATASVRHPKHLDPRFPPRVQSVAAAIYEPLAKRNWSQENGKRVEIPPEISQWQLRFTSCVQNGWQWNMGIELFHKYCLQNQRSQTKWIHFPLNNRSWVEDICKAMYRHQSLRTELVAILSFIHDTFDEIDRPNPFRDYAVHGQILPTVTDQGEGKSLFPVSSEIKSERKTKITWGKALQPKTSIEAIDTSHNPQPGGGSLASRFHSAEAPSVMGKTEKASHREGKNDANPAAAVSTTTTGAGEDMTVDIANEHTPPYAVGSIVMPFIDIDRMWPGFVDDKIDCVDTGTTRKTSNTLLSEADKILSSTEQDHIERLKQAQKAFGSHTSRSLDHYFHRDMHPEQVQKANADQVLSRFIHHHRMGHTRTVVNPARCSSKASWELDGPTKPRWKGFRGRFSKTKAAGQLNTSYEAAPDIEALGIDHSALRTSLHTPESGNITPMADQGSNQVPQRVLVVPQLWLWKIDNVLITTCSDRWDSSDSNTLSEYIRSRVESRNPSEAENGDVLHDIVESCLEFQPSFAAFGRQFTYQEAFSGEIARISRVTTKCYESFREGLGKSDDRFLDAFGLPTDCMVEIDDVLNEITMIRRVHEDQVRVWEDLHKNKAFKLSCECQRDSLPHVQRLYRITKRLEEDALKVRESVVTLLSLLQGEASTENALKTAQQSKILAVFTVVTVVFTPLSWVSALFALTIEDFHTEGPWTIVQVATGSFGSVMGTLALCAIGWLWLNRENVATRRRNTP